MVMLAKTASGNIAFKAAKMSETAFETQAAFVTRGAEEEAFSLKLREHGSLSLVDLGRSSSRK